MIQPNEWTVRKLPGGGEQFTWTWRRYIGRFRRWLASLPAIWSLTKTIIAHKWYVLVAGRRLRVPLRRLLTHDLSKFSPAEFPHYARQFYGDQGDPAGFASAWLHHQNRNPHHWEYWVGRSAHVKGAREGGPLPMSMPAVREMVADWFAAGKVYAGAWPDPINFTWYEQNRGPMQLHVDTEMRIDLVLVEAASWEWK